jgi:hypothetical protein
MQQDSKFYEIVTTKEAKYRQNYAIWKQNKKRPAIKQAVKSFKS